MLGYLKRLSDFRKAAGLTQLELANILNISQANIARIEKNPETISIQQLDLWLKACQLIPTPNASFYKILSSIPGSNITQFTQGVEEVFRSVGMDIDLRRKPLLAVCTETTSTKEQSLFIRSLLSAGDRLFFGYYLPPDGCTVLWKHISDRPHDMENSVYVLDGILEPRMRSCPTKYLDTAISYDDEQVEKAGSFAIVDEVSKKKVIVVFGDHPLLKYFDLIQIPPFSYEIQSFHNFNMATNAEIRVLCIEHGLQLSAPALLTSIAAGREFDFIVCREGVFIENIQRIFSRIYKRKPNVFILHRSSSVLKGCDKAIAELGNLVIQHHSRAQSEVLRILNDSEYIPDDKSLGIIRGSPLIDDLSVRDRVIFKLANVFDASYPLTIQQLGNIFSLISITINPRFDPINEIDEKYFNGLLNKAFVNIDESILKEVYEKPYYLRNKFTKSARELIETTWKNFNAHSA